MASKELLIRYEEFETLSECPEKINELYLMACSAAKNAYAPFSNFRVGAAIELADGSIYQSSNQENQAYPSGLCAERTGLFYVNSIKPDVSVIRIVLVAFDQHGQTTDPVYPCGACRQVMAESEDRGGHPMETWMIGRDKIHKTNSVSALLPLKFSFTSSSDQ